MLEHQGIKEQPATEYSLEVPRRMSKELVVRMQPMQIAIFIKVLNTDFFSF